MLLKILKIIVLGKITTGWVETEKPRKDNPNIVRKGILMDYRGKRYKILLEKEVIGE